MEDPITRYDSLVTKNCIDNIVGELSYESARHRENTRRFVPFDNASENSTIRLAPNRFEYRAPTRRLFVYVDQYVATLIDGYNVSRVEND